MAFVIVLLIFASTAGLAFIMLWLAAQEPEKHHGVCVRHYREGKRGEALCPDCGVAAESP